MSNAKTHNKLTGIEAARGAAALIVVVSHSLILNFQALQSGAENFNITRILEVGRTGVDFFFVLSGFIIFYIHNNDFGRPSTFVPYWKKRIIRLVPIYWFCSLLILALYLVSPSESAGSVSVTAVVQSLLFIPQFQQGPILSTGWSLEYEMFFYLLFSFAILNRALGFVALTLMLIAIVLTLLGVEVWHPFKFDAYPFFLQFVVGMLTAHLTLKKSKVFNVSSLLFGVSLFIGGWFLHWFGILITNSVLGKCIFAFATFFIIGSLASIERSKPLNLPNWLIRLGTISYSLYLIHIIVIIVLGEIFQRLNLYHQLNEWFVVAFVTVTSILCADILNRLIEVKASHYLRKRFL